MTKNLYKNKLIISLVLLLVVFLILSDIVVVSSETKVFQDPQEILLYNESVYLGYRFNITLWIQDIEDFAAWQVQMNYNDTIINATRWFEPTWDTQYVFYGKTTIPAPQDTPHPDGGYYLTTYSHTSLGEGKIIIGTCRFPAPLPGQGFTGSGKLAIVEFIVTLLPPEGEIYSCVLGIDNPSTYFLKVDGSEISVSKENGYYAVPELRDIFILAPLFLILFLTVILHKKYLRNIK